jgi:hypothetical protein
MAAVRPHLRMRRVSVDVKCPWGGNFRCEQVTGRGLIGGSTPNDNLTRRRLTYT